MLNPFLFPVLPRGECVASGEFNRDGNLHMILILEGAFFCALCPKGGARILSLNGYSVGIPTSIIVPILLSSGTGSLNLNQQNTPIKKDSPAVIKKGVCGVKRSHS